MTGAIRIFESNDPAERHGHIAHGRRLLQVVAAGDPKLGVPDFPQCIDLPPHDSLKWNPPLSSLKRP
jgi:hypothetical protein